MVWCVQKYERYNENDPTDIRDLLTYKDEQRWYLQESCKKDKEMRQYLRPHGFITFGGIYVQKLPISI